MKTHHFLLIGFIFVTTISFGQSEEETEIRRLEKHWTELLDRGDTTSLLQIWSENYVVNNPNGKIVSPKDIIALMKSGHKFPAVERIIEKITFNQNIAIVMGKELQQPGSMIADREQWIPRRFTNIWIKSENGWQLASRQSSRQIIE